MAVSSDPAVDNRIRQRRQQELARLKEVEARAASGPKYQGRIGATYNRDVRQAFAGKGIESLSGLEASAKMRPHIQRQYIDEPTAKLTPLRETKEGTESEYQTAYQKARAAGLASRYYRRKRRGPSRETKAKAADYLRKVIEQGSGAQRKKYEEAKSAYLTQKGETEKQREEGEMRLAALARTEEKFRSDWEDKKRLWSGLRRGDVGAGRFF